MKKKRIRSWKDLCLLVILAGVSLFAGNLQAEEKSDVGITYTKPILIKSEPILIKNDVNISIQKLCIDGYAFVVASKYIVDTTQTEIFNISQVISDNGKVVRCVTRETHQFDNTKYRVIEFK